MLPVSGQVSNRAYAQKATRLPHLRARGGVFRVSPWLQGFLQAPFLMGWALWWETRAGVLGLRCSSEEWGSSCRKAYLLHMVKLRLWKWVVPQSELLLMWLKGPHCVKDQPGLLCSTGFLSKMTCFKTLGNKRRQKGERVKCRSPSGTMEAAAGSGSCFAGRYLTLSNWWQNCTLLMGSLYGYDSFLFLRDNRVEARLLYPVVLKSLRLRSLALLC